MGVTLLMLAIAIESFFTIWTIVTRESHSLEKVVIRTGSTLLLIVLLVIGVLDGFMRYGMFVFVLLLQVGIGYFTFRKKKRNRLPEEDKLENGLETQYFIPLCFLWQFYFHSIRNQILREILKF